MDPYLKDQEVCIFLSSASCDAELQYQICALCSFTEHALSWPSCNQSPSLSIQDDDSEDLDDMTIKPEDAVIVCARNEDDVSHLEACNT